MKKYKICIAGLLVLCCLFSFLLSSAVSCKAYSSIHFSDVNKNNAELLSDGQNGFYIFDVAKTDVKVKYITESGFTYGASFVLNVPCQSYSAYNGVVYFAGRDDAGANRQQTCVTSYDFYNDTMRVTYLNGISIKNRCDFVTNGKEFFLVNTAQKKEVTVYSTEGKKLYSLFCDTSVAQLQYDTKKSTLLALTASGLYLAAGSVRSFSFCRGALPQHKIQTLFGGYFADVKGNVYRYNDNTLFLLFKVPFSASGINGAYVADALYFANGKTIDGYALASYTRTKTASFSEPFDYLTSSQNTIGAFCTQSLTFYLFTVQDIPRLPQEKPTSPPQSGSSGSSGGSSGTNTPGAITSSVYRIDNNAQVITGVPSGTTAAGLKKAILHTGYTLTVKKQDGTTKLSGAVGTGMTAVFQYPSGSIKAQYKLVVYGDVTGEGNINSRDKRLFMSVLLLEDTLIFPYTYAADVNKDGVIDAVDLLKVAKLSQ